MSDVLILRPEPGAGATAARAAKRGLGTIVAPLLEVRPLHWDPPEPSAYDALIVTSANAVRFGGLEAFLHLPCYAVGGSSAEAARGAGFRAVRTGPSDGAALLAMMAADGVAAALHPCGRDHAPLNHEGIHLHRVPTYAAEAVSALPEAARTALGSGALALLHSPRSARIFAALIDAAELPRRDMAIAAISAAAAEAAGAGWRATHIAASPRDEALLELAAELCHK